MFGIAAWDRVRRRASGTPTSPWSITLAKLGVIAVLGAGLVAYLNNERGQNISLKGVPIVVPIVVTVLMIGTFLLDRTRFGRYIYAIGGNAEAARRSGINVAAIRWWAFIVCSLLAVFAGVFYVSKVGSADASTGREIVLSGVAAAVVGGVSLFGGRGRLVHAAIGAMMIAVINNGLGLLGWGAGWNLVASGIVLVLAATVDALARKRSGGGAAKA
jgi:D-xylose transport system permease protein